MDMPPVKTCDATECAFNRSSECHAHAITIGDPAAAQCDTFFMRPAKGGDTTIIAGVGACKITDCEYNQDLNCTASAIEVGHDGKRIVCLTCTA